MKVKQIYELMNDVMKEVLGEEATLLNEDLSNVVDIGGTIVDKIGYDPFCKALVNRIGKTIFVNRKYEGDVPSILMDSWEFGSILQKISAEMPEASANESWELEDGQSYDTNVFHKSKVHAKYFNKMVTLEFVQSITEKQLRQSFSSATELNAFVSMLYNEVDKSMTVKMSQLIMMTINNMIAETMYDYNSAGTYTGAGNTRAINLLYIYNNKTSSSLTTDDCLEDPGFLRFASKTIAIYRNRMRKISKLFNIGGTAKFTPESLQKVVLLNDFVESVNTNLQSGTFHKDLVALPKADIVSYWQGTGDSYDFDVISEVKVKTSSGHDVDVTGVLGVIFDRDACAVCNEDRRVTTHYVASAEFWNNWHKFDCRYLNDTNENFVVFYVA